jgi:tRNA threonylcarbamoyladenosine dehydratase
MNSILISTRSPRSSMRPNVRRCGPPLRRHVARLYGAAAFGRLVAAHAVVVGVGGVGSWAAEALARSGVGRITLIDLDHVAESNINRQIHALDGTLGQAKVLAMAARIAVINPDCRVDCIEEFVTPDNVGTLLPQADVVIDCIDQVVAKAALLAWCRQQRIAVITCGAAGGRRDPTRIRRDDLARATGDPLLAKLRHRCGASMAFREIPALVGRTSSASSRCSRTKRWAHRLRRLTAISSSSNLRGLPAPVTAPV